LPQEFSVSTAKPPPLPAPAKPKLPPSVEADDDGWGQAPAREDSGAVAPPMRPYRQPLGTAPDLFGISGGQQAKAPGAAKPPEAPKQPARPPLPSTPKLAAKSSEPPPPLPQAAKATPPELPKPATATSPAKPPDPSPVAATPAPEPPKPPPLPVIPSEPPKPPAQSVPPAPPEPPEALEPEPEPEPEPKPRAAAAPPAAPPEAAKPAAHAVQRAAPQPEPVPPPRAPDGPAEEAEPSSIPVLLMPLVSDEASKALEGRLIAPVMQVDGAARLKSPAAPPSSDGRRLEARSAARRSGIASWAVAVVAVAVSATVIVVTLRNGAGQPAGSETKESATATAASPGLPPPATAADTRGDRPSVESVLPGETHRSSPQAPSLVKAPLGKASASPSAAAQPEPEAEPPPPPATPQGPTFNVGAAKLALSMAAAQAGSCKHDEDGAGSAKVTVTFAPSGHVASAQVTAGTLQGTKTGTCIAGLFRSATVPPFEGDAIAVTKDVSLP
jgi:hypothetical protein